MRKKSLARIQAQATSEEHGLQRSLTSLHIILLGIGGIIGAGIFVLTGQAAAQYAGPAIVISFILSGLGCAFAALCYAEFAAMIPVAGSAYTYSYATLGEFIAWVIGWDLILEYLFGAATVAVGWSGYMVSFLADFGIYLPASLAQSPLVYDSVNGWSQTGSIINAPAMLIVAICTCLLVIGIKQSAAVNNVVVFIKVAVILLFIGCGINYIDVVNYTPFIPENTGEFGRFGWSGIVTGAAVVFFAYIGFDSVSTLAQEAKDPQRSMPIGIIGSLGICTIIYIAVALVITGIVKYPLLNDPAPIAVAVNAAGEGLFWLRPLVKIGAIAGLSSVVLVLLMAQPRIFYAMSTDGLLPKKFSLIHPKYKTPYFSTYVTGFVCMLTAGILPIGILGELVSIGTLLAFVIVSLGIWVLRRTDPAANRPFRCPWVPTVPIIGALVAGVQMYALPTDTWIRLIVWMLIGFAIYFLYGRKHSLIGKEQS